MDSYWRSWVLGFVTVTVILAAMFVPPIAQDPGYHRFVDIRAIAGVPNFWDVVSNLGFLLVGVYGLTKLPYLASRVLRPAYVTFCLGVIAVAFGSGYYHFSPSTPTLVWDRLPMSVAFMALFFAVLVDRVPWKGSARLLWPLVIVGVGSVVYWGWSETQGRGDLRPYAVVQFLPLLLMPLMLLFYRGSARSEPWLWSTFGAYLLAKVMEYYDAAIYQALGLSGHTIKHLLSAVAVLFAVQALLRLDLAGDAEEVNRGRTRDQHRARDPHERGLPARDLHRLPFAARSDDDPAPR